MPILSSECCSCETMRDENVKPPHDPNGDAGFDGACLQQQVNWTQSLNYSGWCRWLISIVMALNL